MKRRFVATVTAIVAVALLSKADNSECRGQDRSVSSRFQAERSAHLVLSAAAFDVDRRFILDTGASVTAFDDQFRSQLKKHGSTDSLTAGGNVRFQAYRQPQLTISSMLLSTSGQAVVFDMSDANEALGQRIDGIIGLNALSGHVLRIAVDEAQFEILNSVPPTLGKEIPILLNKRGGLELEMRYCGSATKERFLIDTGSLTELTVRADAFDLLQSKGEIKRLREVVVVTANGPVRKKEGVLSVTNLDGWAHNDIIVSRGTTFNIVGLNYLNRYSVTFDFPGRRLFLKPGKYFAEKSRRTCLGVGIYWRDEQVRLKYVLPDSPAAEAGLKADDIIESVNGKPVDGSSLFKLRRLFENDGETVSLSLRRGDHLETVKIKLVDF